MTSTRPSRSAAERDPLVTSDSPESLRWWIVVAVVATVLAIAAVVVAAVLVQQTPWEPVSVPTGLPQ